VRVRSVVESATRHIHRRNEGRRKRWKREMWIGKLNMVRMGLSLPSR